MNKKAVLIMHASKFAAAKSAIKDANGKVVQIPNWKLAAIIDTAKELGFIKEDVHRFCHYVRDYRNYIHPYEQYSQRFSSRYYLVCMVFHDQEKDISRQIEVLEQNLVEPRGSDPIGGTPRKLGRTY